MFCTIVFSEQISNAAALTFFCQLGALFIVTPGLVVHYHTWTHCSLPATFYCCLLAMAVTAVVQQLYCLFLKLQLPAAWMVLLQFLLLSSNWFTVIYCSALLHYFLSYGPYSSPNFCVLANINA